MEIKYVLWEDDFLIHQLYIASKSASIRKKRRASRYFISILYAVAGLVSFYGYKLWFAITCFVLAVLWFLFRPALDRIRYQKHYHKYISETYKERFGRETHTVFGNDHFQVMDDGSEVKIALSEVSKMVEISSHIFVRLKTSGSLIIPKSKQVPVDELRNYLKDLAEKNPFDYETELGWTWK